jgi:hypothetical protein
MTELKDMGIEELLKDLLAFYGSYRDNMSSKELKEGYKEVKAEILSRFADLESENKELKEKYEVSHEN